MLRKAVFRILINSRGDLIVTSSKSTVEVASPFFLVEDFFPVEGGCLDLMAVVSGSMVFFLLLKTREIGPMDGTPLMLGIDPKEIT